MYYIFTYKYILYVLYIKYHIYIYIYVFLKLTFAERHSKKTRIYCHTLK